VKPQYKTKLYLLPERERLLAGGQCGKLGTNQVAMFVLEFISRNN
jgi:hypothetical protein